MGSTCRDVSNIDQMIRKVEGIGIKNGMFLLLWLY